MNAVGSCVLALPKGGIGKIIEEGLLLRGIKPMEGARELVARARTNSGLNEEEALAAAVAETRSARS